MRDGLTTPGPALLDVVLQRQEFVLPPMIEAKQVLGMALHPAKGILSGGCHANGVVELIGEALKP